LGPSVSQNRRFWLFAETAAYAGLLLAGIAIGFGAAFLVAEITNYAHDVVPYAALACGALTVASSGHWPTGPKRAAVPVVTPLLVFGGFLAGWYVWEAGNLDGWRPAAAIAAALAGGITGVGVAGQWRKLPKAAATVVLLPVAGVLISFLAYGGSSG
jgi:hypothetical protein